MLDRLMDFLSGTNEEPGIVQTDLDLAVAALLVEAARMDDVFDDAERATIESLLAKRFELSESDAATLVARADERVQASAQYFRFTHEIVQRMSEEERGGVIEMLWRVAYADGELDPHEDALIRQIAGLIHVTDRDRARARQRALGTPQV
ncbi:MAG: TerB family tellurite resistance protein [Pseudomonadota bacterium]